MGAVARSAEDQAVARTIRRMTRAARRENSICEKEVFLQVLKFVFSVSIVVGCVPVEQSIANETHSFLRLARFNDKKSSNKLGSDCTKANSDLDARLEEFVLFEI